jgi:mannan endo-1,4-beta-mannosidase
MKHIYLLLLLPFFPACANNNGSEPEEEKTPVLVSTSLPSGNLVSPSTDHMELVFDGRVAVIDPQKITLNNTPAAGATATGNTLTVSTGRLAAQTDYTLSILPHAIKAIPGVMNRETIRVTFRTSEAPSGPGLVVANPSPEAQKVYAFLQAQQGAKIISGTVANVNWNINEAQWVHQHTGHWPALNGFDYIHLNGNWVDYTNTGVVEAWWAANGLVTCMWHWNVPTAQGSSSYAFYTQETSFDVSKAVQDGTYENGIVKADLEKVADRLLLLQQKNIPVLWRPLHEAAGGWFWWGAKGAAPLKALWRLMFETFEAKGLNNLIWVWTAEPNDDSWYPGDAYVDIAGRDIYHKTIASQMQAEYATLKSRFPGKPITLSECGDVAGIADQWDAGATWSWFMPWYDYNRTNTPGSAVFNSEAHEHANAAFWRNAFASDKVLDRDDMPNLK